MVFNPWWRGSLFDTVVGSRVAMRLEKSVA